MRRRRRESGRGTLDLLDLYGYKRTNTDAEYKSTNTDAEGARGTLGLLDFYGYKRTNTDAQGAARSWRTGGRALGTRVQILTQNTKVQILTQKALLGPGGRAAVPWVQKYKY
jgi:hypothetical protein